MLEISNFTNGQILNRHDGIESHDRLTIKVFGIAHPCAVVTVNGVKAARSGQMFSATIDLTQRLNEIVARSTSIQGIQETRITVMWDKASYKRTSFCVDDNIFFLSEIARDRPKSLFDHFYLKGFQQLHEKYGMKVTLNLFYRNDHFPFELKDFPADYKPEWKDNADWLRLAFHAYSEFPDRPYQNTAPDVIARDYDLVRNEIVRFAGEDTLIVPSNLHWGMAKPASMAELRKRGVVYQTGTFLNAVTYIGEQNNDINTTDIGFYLNEEQSHFIQQHQALYDSRHDMIFGLDAIICNLEEIPVLKAHLQQLLSDPTNDCLQLITHEQYFYPFYENYLPDHFQRLDLAAKMLTEAGYKYTYFNEGIFGNHVWDN